MSTRSAGITIGTLAAQAGVNVETIRFYQRRGLLAVPARPLGGTRRYGEQDVERVRFIKAAQRLGFTLDEVAQLLLLDDGTHCREAAALAAGHLAEVRARIDDLQRLEATLSRLLHKCDSARGAVACPLIVSLQRG